jgi:Rieske 2Fe-2S family protein
MFPALDAGDAGPYPDCMVSQDLTAPLDPAQLAASLRPFGSSRMLPRDAYTSDAVFTWEQERFFTHGWTCLGRASDLPQPGDQRAFAAGRGGVVLVRGSDGVLRGFANACRHRGHELVACGLEPVNRGVLVCPYHGWSYKLDGTLRRTPGFEPGDDFDAAGHGLVGVPAEEWQGFVFVNPSGTAGPLADHLAGLGLLAAYETERLVVAGHHDYVVRANWKILNENYQECYHCPVIHPELCTVSPPESGTNYVHSGQGAWVGGHMDLRPGAETMSLDGRSGVARLRGVAGEWDRRVIYIGIFPNLLLSLHPDYVMTHVLTPMSAGETRVVCEWAFAPEELARTGFDPAFAVDFWDVTNREDWAACESVQRGLSSPLAVPGPLSRDEDAVYQFVTMVARAYAGERVVAGGF